MAQNKPFKEIMDQTLASLKNHNLGFIQKQVITRTQAMLAGCYTPPANKMKKDWLTNYSCVKW
jgi:hypothetical protein